MVFLNPHLKGRYITFFNHDMQKNDHLSSYEKILTTPWVAYSKIFKAIY